MSLFLYALTVIIWGLTWFADIPTIKYGSRGAIDCLIGLQ